MTAEAHGNNPSITLQPPGWALFPAATKLMQGGAPALLAALQEERLKAFLLIRVRPNWGSRDDDDGSRFEISTRYWTTDNALQAMRGGWVQAPVLKLNPRDPTRKFHYEVNKGGYVLLEEKAIRAHIAGDKTSGSDGPALEKARSAAGQAVAAGTPLTKESLREALGGVSRSKKGFDRIYSKVKEEHPHAFKGPGRPNK
jgi:hypothetical protein